MHTIVRQGLTVAKIFWNGVELFYYIGFFLSDIKGLSHKITWKEHDNGLVYDFSISFYFFFSCNSYAHQGITILVLRMCSAL
jgi:hypothetical protein